MSYNNFGQSAAAVLAATMSPQIHPSGFRISDRPVAASFAHPYSFQPITDLVLRDEACLTSSPSLGGVEDSWVRYWDETSMIAVLEFQIDEPAQPTVPATKDKKEKKKTKGEEMSSGDSRVR
jgi:RNA-binding protein 5/10